MLSHLALGFCGILIAFAAHSCEAVTAAAVHAQIEEKGPRAAIESLFRTPAWDAAIRGIASGNEAWLQVALELAPGSDAGSASELKDAIAWALPHAPDRVIAVSEKHELFRDVCDVPPVDYPPEGRAAYFAAAISAVEGISDSSLKAAKASCLSKLRVASKHDG
jgi:hypothetical protein